MIPDVRVAVALSVVALFVVGCAAQGKNDRFQSLRSAARTLQVQTENCPTSFSLMHCVDPTEDHIIPCDTTTCLWDLTSLKKDSPPGFCGFIGSIELNDNLPDELKPCVLWNQFFGNALPTINPAPMNAPFPVPIIGSPTTSPTIDVRIFKVTLDRIILNIYFRSPSARVNQALNDAWTLQELQDTVNMHIQENLRSRTGNDIATDSVLVPIEPASAPWKNTTVIATLALTTRIRSDSTSIKKNEFQLFVIDSFREATMLKDLQALDSPPFKLAYDIYIGRMDLTDATRVSQADQPIGAAPTSNKLKWWTFWEKEFWLKIQWGDLTDHDFISFVAVVGLLTLFATLFVLVRCCRRYRAFKLERDVLSAAKLTFDDGSVAFYAANDLERVPTDATSPFVIDEADGGQSIRSEVYSYAEDDSRDIQSFSVDPGTNMSALDFSITKYANPPEGQRVLPHESEDEEESLESRSTISHHPVNLEEAKGTVVCYDIDNDSLSTTSDSMIGSMLDFVRAAWQQPKNRLPQNNIFSQKIPKIPVARSGPTQSSVMAVVASLEAAAKSTSLKPSSPRKINVLSVVEEIERENQEPIDLESQNGASRSVTTSRTGTEESSKISHNETLHRTGTEASSKSGQNETLSRAGTEVSSKQSQHGTVSRAGTEVSSKKDRSETNIIVCDAVDPCDSSFHTIKCSEPPTGTVLDAIELSTPLSITRTIIPPLTPEKKPPPSRILTLECYDKERTHTTAMIAPTVPVSTTNNDKKSSVQAVAAAFEKANADVASKRTKSSGVKATIASFEQNNSKTTDSPYANDLVSKFRELAYKKALPTKDLSEKETVSQTEETNEPKEFMKILPLRSQSPLATHGTTTKAPVSILKPSVTKRSGGSVMDVIKAFESKSRSKQIKQSVSFDDSLPSLSRMSQSPEKALSLSNHRPSRDLSSPVRLTELMDDTESNGTNPTLGSSSTSECVSPVERNASLRANIDTEAKSSFVASPSPENQPGAPLRRSRATHRERSKSDVSPEMTSGSFILRSWSDSKPSKDFYASPAFTGKSVRKSKASKMVLSDDSELVGLTPATLPSTPLSPIEYQESETSDIKSICSRECFGVSPLR